MGKLMKIRDHSVLYWMWVVVLLLLDVVSLVLSREQLMVDWIFLIRKNGFQDMIVMPRSMMLKCIVNVSLVDMLENTWNIWKKKITPSTNNNSHRTLRMTLKPTDWRNCMKVSMKPSVKILLLRTKKTFLRTNPTSAKP